MRNTQSSKHTVEISVNEQLSVLCDSCFINQFISAFELHYGMLIFTPTTFNRDKLKTKLFCTCVISVRCCIVCVGSTAAHLLLLYTLISLDIFIFHYIVIVNY